MNDRYLYRAKRMDNGEWAIGYYAVVGKKEVIIEKEPQDFYSIESAKETHGNKIVEVDPSTICQCTGKRDEEKKLIFEHDIVAFIDCTSTENGYSEHGCVGEVLWDDETLSFQVTGRLSAESYEVLGGTDCKVLGNIFDTPELLEVEL